MSNVNRPRRDALALLAAGVAAASTPELAQAEAIRLGWINCGKAGPLPASIVSTIRIRQAGFADCIDTEDMLRKWIDRFERLRWIPPRGATRVPGRR